MWLPKSKAKENGHCQKTCEGFWQLFGKGRLFGRPFFKTNPQELSTLCIYPIKRLNNTKNVSINKTLSISTLAQYFILQLWRNIPLTTMTSIELRLLNTCCITQKVRCWGGNNQKGTAKEQGHGRMTYKVFGLNPFYWFGEDNWNITFKQKLRNQQPCNLLPKSPEPYQERRWQSRILHSGLTLNHALVWGMGQ